MDEQLVIFTLTSESYGVGVGYVQSIMQMPLITVVPGTARSIEGVINLRGAMVPVVDLRTRFELPPPPEGHKKVIVVIRYDCGPCDRRHEGRRRSDRAAIAAAKRR